MYFILKKEWCGIVKFLISLFNSAEVAKRMLNGLLDLFIPQFDDKTRCFVEF